MTTPDTSERTSWNLARLAECSDPDAHDGRGFDHYDGPPVEGSPGAQWLRHVENAAGDILGDAESLADNPGDTLAERADYNGRLHETADGAVPDYTHERWQVFVDLCAYQEDTDELAGPDTDMNDRAGIALYMIAERLLRAILDAEEPEDDEDDEDE